MADLQTPLTHTRMLGQAEKACAVLRALSHPQRLCILCHLSKRPMIVSELVELCSLSQPQVSQFLASLREEGLIASEKNGRTVVYSVEDARVLVLIKTLADLYCGEIL